MKERLLFGTTALLLVCYGCTGEEISGLSSLEAAAKNAVESTANLDLLVEDPADPEALFSLTRIYADLSAVANASRDGAAFFVNPLTQKAPLDQCITQDGPVITYDDCTLRNGTIGGTITSSGDELDFDLRIAAEGVGGAGSLAVRMRGGVVLTDTSLAGSLAYETIILGLEDYPDGLSFTMDADYIGIALDDVQCPLSGSLVVGQEFPDDTTAPVEAVFGPLCEDVSLSE